MNFAEEEPRKVPKPVPFSESSLHPSVPEVSLILQETQRPSPTQSSNSFSGTEFQTYNAWRWKNLNDREKENLEKKKEITKKKNEFHPINDKFSGSSIERRKNEILYGSMDEPRRPLPPRQVPVIPKFLGASFSDASFSNEPWDTDDRKGENFLKEKKIYLNQNNKISDNYLKCNKQESQSWFGEPNDIKDFYQTIAQQNTHMVQLQKHIEQLLKSQDIKEKQIEQLLKTQEAKDTKIEQLLKMQDVKENHIEQLLKAQEKQEKQIEQLILSQEKKEKQMHEISKQFKKEVTSVGVMTAVSVADKSTNTDFQCFCKRGCNKGIAHGNNHPVEESSIDVTRFGSGDQSLTLHSLNLPAIQEHAPTPQSSIHVDIPEYNGSSDDESDSSISESKETLIHCMSDMKPSGYTFYNNVLTQVNDIIQSQDDKENQGTSTPKNAVDFEKSKTNKHMCLKELSGELVKPVKNEKNDVDNLWKVTDFQNEPGLGNNNLRGINFAKENPSDISLRMNALALKYLKREQISQYELQSQLLTSNRQPDVTIYNVTNLSFGTMRYLEKHKISVGENCLPKEHTFLPHQLLQQKTKATLFNSKRDNIQEGEKY